MFTGKKSNIKMISLKELRIRKKRLQYKAYVKAKQRKRAEERARLKEEIFQLEHPKTVKVCGVLISGKRKIFKSIGKGVKAGVKKARAYDKKVSKKGNKGTRIGLNPDYFS